MRKEFKVKRKLMEKVSWDVIIRNEDYHGGILIGNEKFNVKFEHECNPLRKYVQETNVEIKECDNYKDFCVMQHKMFPKFNYLATIDAKECWIASDIEDINKIGERLDNGEYEIYNDDYYENFILLKLPEEKEL